MNAPLRLGSDGMTLIIDGEQVEVRAISLGDESQPDLVGELADGRRLEVDIEQQATAAAEDAAQAPLRIGPDGCILPGQGVEGGVDFSRYGDLKGPVFEVNVPFMGPECRWCDRSGQLLEYRSCHKWEVIGTTRGNPRDPNPVTDDRPPRPEVSNRLRKFVQRAGQLVEVRTRGRTGHRSLEEAVLAAKK